MQPKVPAYFDFLIDAFQRGLVGRFVHVGHWDEAARDPTSRAPDSKPAAHDEFAQAQARLNDILVDMADVRDGHNVLDVGCGFGGTLQRIDSRLTDMRLVGVNIDPRQLAICRQLLPRNNNQLAWVEADACDLPFPEGSFDRVLCIEAMFHFRSRRTFFAEAARVLRPGGALVISDIVLDKSAPGLEMPHDRVETILRDIYGPWPDFWCEEGGHRQLAAAAGLECTRELDATAATRPSHRFTVPAGIDEDHDPGDPALRAGLLLKRLHDRGVLKYVYLRFDRT